VAEAVPIIEELHFFLSRQKEYQKHKGVKFSETRLHLPYRYGPEVNRYLLRELLQVLQLLSDSDITMTLALTLSRDNPFIVWNILKQVLREPLGIACTAVDFCGDELSSEPGELENFARDLHTFNAENPNRSVAFLIHAGEILQDGSLESSIRRVHTAAKLGAHRIGHATVLGVDPTKIPADWRWEKASSRCAQLRYDLIEYEALCKAGVVLNRQELEDELNDLNEIPHDACVRIKPFDVEDIRARQRHVSQYLAGRGTVVECCPTSNIIIGGLASFKDHPIAALLRSGIRVVLATDDEGLFDTDLQTEFSRLWSADLLTEADVTDLEQNSRDCLSTLLCGRSMSPLKELTNPLC
jgi:hypothetical protein